MFKREKSFFSQFKFRAEEEEEEEEIVETPQEEEEEEAVEPEEEEEEDDEDDEEEEEELVDPKIEIDHHCEHHCENELKEYLACAERIKLLPEGTHCHSWFTDYKGCVAHCVSYKEKKKKKSKI